MLFFTSVCQIFPQQKSLSTTSSGCKCYWRHPARPLPRETEKGRARKILAAFSFLERCFGRVQSFLQNLQCKIQQLPYLFFRSPGQLGRSVSIDPNKSYPTNLIRTELFRKQVHPAHPIMYVNIQLKICVQYQCHFYLARQILTVH